MDGEEGSNVSQKFGTRNKSGVLLLLGWRGVQVRVPYGVWYFGTVLLR